ncbi:hypothetical protein [Dialister hominis]|uniref:hypothetical protein n=1 Tax=Dialister hominis TaxID=2582419 RepID=UPI001396C312|nr:hypothetical protein [Dialister hominis]
MKQFLEKRKQNVSRETFLGWIKGGRKRETAPAAKGAVTKWLIILLQPLFCVFISSFLALL